MPHGQVGGPFVTIISAMLRIAWPRDLWPKIVSFLHSTTCNFAVAVPKTFKNKRAFSNMLVSIPFIGSLDRPTRWKMVDSPVTFNRRLLFELRTHCAVQHSFCIFENDFLFPYAFSAQLVVSPATFK